VASGPGVREGPKCFPSKPRTPDPWQYVLQKMLCSSKQHPALSSTKTAMDTILDLNAIEPETRLFKDKLQTKASSFPYSCITLGFNQRSGGTFNQFHSINDYPLQIIFTRTGGKPPITIKITKNIMSIPKMYILGGPLYRCLASSKFWPSLGMDKLAWNQNIPMVAFLETKTLVWFLLSPLWFVLRML